jgi:hypothetical protein
LYSSLKVVEKSSNITHRPEALATEAGNNPSFAVCRYSARQSMTVRFLAAPFK